MTLPSDEQLTHMRLLQAVLDSSPYIIQVFSAVFNEKNEIIDFVWTMNNQKGVEQNGPVIGKSLLMQNPAVAETGIFDKMRQVAKTGVPCTQEIKYSYEQFDGWFRQSLVKLNDGVVMTTEDITELKASRDLAQTVFEVASNPMAYHKAIRDEKGQIVDFEFKLENKEARKYSEIDRKGQRYSDVYPGINNTHIFQLYCDVVETGHRLDTEVEITLKGVAQWFHLTAAKLDDGLISSAVDISQRKKTEKEIHELKDKIALNLKDRYYSIFNAIDDGFCIYEVLYNQENKPYDLKWIEVNPAYQIQTGLSDVVGKLHSELSAGTEQYWFDLFDQVIRTGEAGRSENLHEPTGRWYRVLASRVGEAAGRQVAVIFEDITERKQREQQQAYLLKLNDALRSLADPIAIQQVAMQLLGEFLKADRVVYADVEGEEFVLNDNYVGEGVQKLTGRFPFGTFGASVSILKKGKAVITDDVSLGNYDDLERENFFAVGVHAVLAIPIVKNGIFVGNLSVHHQTPRKWKEDEIALTTDTAERVWTALERVKAEQALRKSEEKYRTLFENIDESFVLVELVFDAYGKVSDFIYLEENPKHAETTGIPKVIGKKASELLPNLEAKWLASFNHVYDTGEAIRGEDYNADTNRWYRFYHSRVGGSGSRLIASVSLDTTEQKRREQHQAFILNFSDRLRKEPNPDAIANLALELLIAYLQLDRSYIVSYYLDENKALLDYQMGNDTVPPLPEIFDLSQYPEAYKAILDQTLVIEDELERQGLSEAEKEKSSKLGMRAMVAATLRKGEYSPLWSMVAISSKPRRWQTDDIQLIEKVAERTWSAIERSKAEKEMEESRKRFQSIANLVPDLLWDSEPDGSTNWYNKRWLAYRGQSLEEAIGLGLIDAIHPDDREGWTIGFYEAVLTGNELRQEHRIRRHDGAYCWFVVNASPVIDPNGQVVKMYGSATDIHDRKIAEEALRESEKRFRTLTQTSPVGIAVNSLEGRIIYVNQAYANIINYSPEELLQKPSGFVYDEPREREAWLNDISKPYTLSNHEVRFRQKNGNPVWVSISAATIEYGGQQAMLDVVLDVNEHKQTAIALRDAELKYRTHLEPEVQERTAELQQNRELLQATLDSNHEMIQVFQAVRNADGKITDFIWILNNHASEQIYGDVIGKSLVTHNPGVKKEGIFKAFVEVTESGIAQQYEKKYKYEQFEGWFDQSVVKLNDGVATTTLNITARKKAELRLKENRDQLSSILDTTLVQMSILKAIRDSGEQVIDLEIIAVNKQLESVTGRTDLIGKKYTEEYPGIRDAGLFDLIIKTIETGQPQSTEYLYSYDGFNQWFSCAFVKLNDGVVATNMDITVRKAAEEERLKNYTLLKQSEDLAFLGSWDYDIISGTFSWSDGMYRLFSIDKGTPVKPEIYMTHATKATSAAVKDLVRHILSGDKDFEETIELKIDGRRKVLHLKGAVIRDEIGRALRVLGVDMDITAMRQAQEKIHSMEAEQQLEIFRVTLETVEEERHRISESLHNGIGQILYAVKIGLSSVTYGGEEDQFKKNKAYISKLLTDAIVETRRISHELMPTTLEEFGLKSAIDDVCSQLSGATRFRCQISGYQGRMEKFLELAVYRTVQELMNNVVKHANATICNLGIHITAAQIRIWVSDNGQGFADQEKAKPGIGLATIRSKIKLLKGKVSVNSVPGRGTDIQVIIPRALKTKNSQSG
ncbi:PAS domain S-box protein [Pedobacter terrae]|uniref:PAS domain S-box protein n=1 Tax=Pedobacter terrae TaxID=405671 RepID=UPI002FF6BAE2